MNYHIHRIALKIKEDYVSVMGYMPLALALSVTGFTLRGKKKRISQRIIIGE